MGFDIDVNSSSGPEYADLPGQVSSLSARSNITFGDHYHILEENVIKQLTNDFVQFNGLRFDLRSNRADAQPAFEGQRIVAEQKCMIDFMKVLQDNAMFEKPNAGGKIVYVEDQFVNQEQMKMHFNDLGVVKQLTIFSDGKEVVDYFEALLQDIDSKQAEWTEGAKQPISLLLLDINIPIINGLDVFVRVKQMFK